MYDLIDGIRRHPCFKHVRIVLVVETNIEQGRQIITNMLKTVPNTAALTEPKAGIGFMTTKSNRMRYIEHLKKLFMRKSIRYHSEIISRNRFDDGSSDNSRKANLAKDELECQLYNFRTFYSVNPAGQKRSIGSGKLDERMRNAKTPDDMVLALGGGLFFVGDHLENPSSKLVLTMAHNVHMFSLDEMHSSAANTMFS